MAASYMGLQLRQLIRLIHSPTLTRKRELVRCPRSDLHMQNENLYVESARTCAAQHWLSSSRLYSLLSSSHCPYPPSRTEMTAPDGRTGLPAARSRCCLAQSDASDLSFAVTQWKSSGVRSMPDTSSRQQPSSPYAPSKPALIITMHGALDVEPFGNKKDSNAGRT